MNNEDIAKFLAVGEAHKFYSKLLQAQKRTLLIALGTQAERTLISASAIPITAHQNHIYA